MLSHCRIEKHGLHLTVQGHVFVFYIILDHITADIPLMTLYFVGTPPALSEVSRFCTEWVAKNAEIMVK